MSMLGRRRWGYWNDADMLPLEIQLPSIESLKLPRDIEIRSVRVKGPRGTTDKTGQATRQRIREKLIKIHGAFCHLCLLWGLPPERAAIDLTIPFPDPLCFTRDHVKPRSLKGSLHSVQNQRPAHNRCNTFRGNKTMDQIKDCRPAWAQLIEEA